MKDKSEKPSMWEKFKSKYRFSIYRDETYEEILNLKLTHLNAIIIFGSAVIIFMAVIISIMAFTPARGLIPGYPDQNTVRNMHLNFYRLDSLETELKKRDVYFENIRLIIAGETPPEYSFSSDSSLAVEPRLTMKTSLEDSLLRNMIETSDQYSLSFIEKTNLASSALFFPPVRGIVTNSFNSKLNHYGTDIVAASNEVVKATLAGTVTLASWTLETGYIIQVQHENNLISIYKHNAELLKHMGNRVKAGEPIAIIGNSGELTTGPHLHFELWYNGTPLNPEEYITF
ncbi:MAG: M23 family metallopeptidase [Bacteroidales bacterium]|nr:M23 family metallopeptidase [Bacteroidales bacterium]